MMEAHSTNDAPSVYKAGMIQRIEVLSFGTFKRVVIEPGPNLNLLLGPNGTGKSTILSAIILGLGGHPKTIGRATQLADYIRSNCEEATIIIELKTSSIENVRIVRTFNQQNKSTFEINGHKVSHKDLLELTAKYNIQIENLCQFLPQDKVQDFAKMTNQELLLNTEQSLECAANLSEMHEKLIDLRGQVKKAESGHQNNAAMLLKAQQQNERVQAVVERLIERHQLEEEEKIINSKIAWVTYDIKRTKATELKADRELAGKLLQKATTELQPVREQIEMLNEKINKAVHSSLNMNKSLSNAYNAIVAKIETIQRLTNNLEHQKDTLARKTSDLNQNAQRIREKQLIISRLKNDLQENLKEFGSETAIQEQMEKLERQLNSSNDKMVKINSEKENKRYVVDNLMKSISNLNQRRLNYEDVKRKRLELLQRIDGNIYKSVLWLRENKNLFKGNVYEPMILELNVIDPKNAKFIENIVARRDLLAFTCEETSDMNTLLHHLRTKENLNVSCIHSGSIHPPLARYTPSKPIEDLKRYGFHSYALQLIDGPEAILKYLCRMNGLHQIPIGTRQTDELYENVPPEFRLFFSDTRRFSTIISSYSKERSTSIVEIRQARLLTHSMDVEQVRKILNEIETVKYKLKSAQHDLEALENQAEKVMEHRQTFQDMRKQLRTNSSNIENLNARIVSELSDLKYLETYADGVLHEKENYENETRKQVAIIVEKQRDITASLKNVNLAKIDALKHDLKTRVLKNHLKETKAKASKATNRLNQLQEQLDNIKREMESRRDQAKEAFEVAKSLTNGLTPNDPEFSEFQAKYENYSRDVSNLQELLIEVQTKIECINEGDDGVMREYEERCQLIERLQNESAMSTVQLNKLREKMMILRDRWIEPLGQLIQQISEKFSYFMQTLSCSGNVTLVIPENEQDFDDYGLSIKVSYRQSEHAQELNGFTQSGGERAVATAVYMLSLQHLTAVPFRCVDEINQGMDAINERKIFDLIVSCTGAENTSQYFLITPKLLQGLTYPKNVTVNVVHNGLFDGCPDYFTGQYTSQVLTEMQSI